MDSVVAATESFSKLFVNLSDFSAKLPQEIKSVVEKLPTNMIENPNYHPEEDIEEMDDQERAELINDMFKQEV